MSWLLAFAGFCVLIVLHELGHFAAAKWVGMRVERFSLFFPPILARRKVGETEYAIGAVPLGGYVKISGMNPAEDLPDEVRTRAYYSQPVWKRVVVIAAGPAVNFIVAFILLLAFFWLIGANTPTRQVDQVTPGFPAAGVLEPGDRIVSLNGKPADPNTFLEKIQAAKCETPKSGCRSAQPVTIGIERDGRVREVQVRPQLDQREGVTASGERRTVRSMRIGFSFGETRDPLPFGPAFTTTADRFWFISKETFKLPARLLDSEKRKEISGVVGSYETTRQTIIDNAADAVGILAIISLSLAIVNLFPFLPLDGGHIFWALVELIRRRPVSYATMERAGMVGFALVIGLFIIGFSNDIDRLQNGGFGQR